MNESRCFAAKFAGTCNVCGFTYEIKDQIHYVGSLGVNGGRIAHETCHLPDDAPADWGDGEGGSEFMPHKVPQTAGAPVQGKRRPPYCNDCWTYHNGECP